jgi:uncharacterized protein
MTGALSASEWYAEGLAFGCTQCGNCCTGPPGAVWFNDAEAQAMATERGLSESAFRDRYARKIDGRWSLNEIKTEHGYDCVFLDRVTIPGKAICGMYKSRPQQCRTWPFWPEILASKRSWESYRRQTPCPGMGTGKMVPIESIRIQRDSMIE